MTPAPTVRRFSLFATLTFVGLLAALSGCGSSTGKVTGKVTYNNKAVGGGQVQFVRADDKKKVYTSSITPDGSYQILGITPGEYKVTVEGPNIPAVKMGMKLEMTKAPKGLDNMNDPSGQFQSGTAPQITRNLANLNLPMRYRSPDNSGLKYTVKAGDDNTYDIPLKD